ncbi:MAG TPA: hypothetical protein VF746_04720 [Longimicrobium sp.]|jgi:hypothetical protein
MRRARALFAAITLALLNAGASFAQATPSGPTRVPVTVAIVDSLPRGQGRYIIWRRVSEEPRDVILLLPNATADEFSEAVRSLIIARRQQGDTATAAVKMRTRRQAPAQPLPPPLPWADRVLAELARAERRQVAQVGTVRAVQIWLPRQAGRRR